MEEPQVRLLDVPPRALYIASETFVRLCHRHYFCAAPVELALPHETSYVDARWILGGDDNLELHERPLIPALPPVGEVEMTRTEPFARMMVSLAAKGRCEGEVPDTTTVWRKRSASATMPDFFHTSPPGAKKRILRAETLPCSGAAQENEVSPGDKPIGACSGRRFSVLAWHHRGKRTPSLAALARHAVTPPHPFLHPPSSLHSVTRP